MSNYNGFNNSNTFDSISIFGEDVQGLQGEGAIRYNTMMGYLELRNNGGSWLQIGAGPATAVSAGANISINSVLGNDVISTISSPNFTDVFLGATSLSSIASTVIADLNQPVKTGSSPIFVDATIGSYSMATIGASVTANINQAVKTTSSPTFASLLVSRGTSAPTASLVSTNSASGAIINVTNSLGSNATAAQKIENLIGVDSTVTNNSAAIDFTYAGSGSTSNTLSFGFFGNRDLLKIDALGALTAVSSVSWNNGLGALTIAGSDAVINATNNLKIRCGGSDKLVVNSTGEIVANRYTTTLTSSGSPGLNAVNLSTASCTTIWSLASSLLAGNNVGIYHGVSGTGSYNASIIQFNYNGAGSATNTLGLGFFGANNRWTIDGSGNTVQTGDSTSGRVIATNNTGTIGTVSIMNNATNAYVITSAAVTPNITTGQKSEMYFGKAYSTYDMAVFDFNWTASGSTSNTYGIGFYGANNVWTIDPTGQSKQLGSMVAPSIGAMNTAVGLRAYNLVIDSTSTSVLGGLRVNGTALEFYNGTSWVNASVVAGTNLSYTSNTLSLIASPVVTDITCSGISMNAVAASVGAYLNQSVKSTASPSFVSVVTPSVTSSGANDLFLNAPSGRAVSIGTNNGARITAHDTFVDHWAHAIFWSGTDTDYVSPHGSSWTANSMVLGTGVAATGNLKMNGSQLQYHDGSTYQTVQTTNSAFNNYCCWVNAYNSAGTLLCTVFNTLTGTYNVAYGASNTSLDITLPGSISVAFQFQWSVDSSRCTVPTGISGQKSGSNVVRCIPSYATTGAQTWNNILPNAGDFLTFSVFIATT